MHQNSLSLNRYEAKDTFLYEDKVAFIRSFIHFVNFINWKEMLHKAPSFAGDILWGVSRGALMQDTTICRAKVPPILTICGGSDSMIYNHKIAILKTFASLVSRVIISVKSRNSIYYAVSHSSCLVCLSYYFRRRDGSIKEAKRRPREILMITPSLKLSTLM